MSITDVELCRKTRDTISSLANSINNNAKQLRISNQIHILDLKLRAGVISINTFAEELDKLM